MLKTFRIVLFLSLLLGYVQPVKADTPRIPHAFFGQVTINGAPAAVGSVIQAQAEGVLKDIPGNPILIEEEGSYGGPGGFDPKLLVQGTLEDGTALVFMINGAQAQCAVPEGDWQDDFAFLSSAITELNLRISVEAATVATTQPVARHTPMPTTLPTATLMPTATAMPTDAPTEAPTQENISEATATVQPTVTDVPTEAPTQSRAIEPTKAVVLSAKVEPTMIPEQLGVIESTATEQSTATNASPAILDQKDGTEQTKKMLPTATESPVQANAAQPIAQAPAHVAKPTATSGNSYSLASSGKAIGTVETDATVIAMFSNPVAKDVKEDTGENLYPYLLIPIGACAIYTLMVVRKQFRGPSA